MTSKPTPKKRRAWKIFRRCVRCTRVVLLALVLLVICASTYLSEVGLPDFLKKPLIEGVEKRGVKLRFSRLRWVWLRGFVADNVRIGSATNSPDLPELHLHEVLLEVDHSQLKHFKVKVDGLNLRGGNLSWQLQNTPSSTNSLSISNIQASLRFKTNDDWELDNFFASYKGVRVSLSGEIKNASSLKTWPIFQHQTNAPPTSLQARLQQITRIANQVNIALPSQINIIIHGDATNTSSFDAFMMLRTPEVQTPWCHVIKGDVFLRLSPPPAFHGPSKLAWNLAADAVETDYARVRNFRSELVALGDDKLSDLIRARMESSASKITTSWAEVDNARLSAHWAHSLTNPMPNEGSVALLLTNITTRWANASQARLTASLQTPASSMPIQPEWGFWNALAPYVLGLQADLQNVTAGDFQSPRVDVSGSWKAPFLQITNLYTEMYQGHFRASTSIDVATRRAQLSSESDFDALRAYPLLPKSARDWLDKQKFSYEKPPIIHIAAGATLPEWTNHHPDWKKTVVPTLGVLGDFQIGQGSYRGIQFHSASSHITYTNQTWSLPDLYAERPDGSVRMAFESREDTLDYHFKIDSNVDVKAVHPALDPKTLNVLQRFQWDQPPRLEADLWGRWRAPERIGFQGKITTTNLAYKGEQTTFLTADLAYTNRYLVITRARVERTNQWATADSFGLDLKSMVGHLTNGNGVLDHMVVGRLIGPVTAQSLSPYHFLTPPKVHVEGEVPLSEDISVADLRFNIEGNGFAWWKFHVPSIAGNAHWRGDELMLDNMKVGFYNGILTGKAHFDFDTEEGTDFSFDVNTTNSSLELLMADVSTVTNKFEGDLSGHVLVNKANTSNPLSWFGSGNAYLTNGLIWQIPIFGVLTPVLNGISPGLGESRLGDGSADFIITNSVIRTDNLMVRSPTLRLFYVGTVDFNFKVDAEVEAELGRDTPLLGPLVSVVFMPVGKLFKTRVTGTLRDPKREPVMWLTKIISPLLHPWRIFNLFSSKNGEDKPVDAPSPTPAVPAEPAPVPVPVPVPVPAPAPSEKK